MARGRGRRAGRNAGRASGGPRAGTGHVQPELVGPCPADYWQADEAERYHLTPKAVRVQAELTQSAASIGSLPRGPGLILDLGAGGGLSTAAFQALAAAAKLPGGPPFVLALDASRAMLASQSLVGEVAMVGVTVSGPRETLVDISEGAQWRHSRSDAVLADFSQPLPLRPAVADGILSVSAVQWLLESRRVGPEASPPAAAEVIAPPPVERSGAASIEANEQCVPQHLEHPLSSKLQIFWRSVHCAARPGARVALQFYPPKGDADFGARCLRNAALDAGFSAHVVLDYPHRSAAKKWVLVATRECAHVSAAGIAVPIEVKDQRAKDPWCALCWPLVAARCALQLPPLDASEGGGLPRSAAPSPDATQQTGACSRGYRERVEQQHLELALRLVRCGRRLRDTSGEASAGICARLEQEMHPLQLQLARALATALDEAPPPSKRPRPGTGNDGCSGENDIVRDAEGSFDPTTSAPTRTELRSIVASRLPEVLAVLHDAPEERWTLPPPPLGSHDGELPDVSV